MTANVKLAAGTFELDGQLTLGSMAREIEDALQTLVPVKTGEDPLPRQKFALAVAQGVIRHLAKNADAFVVDVSDTGTKIERTVRVDTK